MATLTNILHLVAGSRNEVRLYLFDEADAAEDLTEFDSGEFSLRSGLSDCDEVLRVSSLTTGTDSTGAYVKFALTAQQANTLVPGTYLGGASIVLDGVTYKTDPFHVQVSAGVP